MVNKRLIMWMLVLVLLSANVLALGLTPGRTTIDFEPNSKHSVSFTVVNEEHQNMKLLVYAEGELAEFIVLHNQVLDFKKTDQAKTFTYDVLLPPDMAPGVKRGAVVIKEIPMNDQTSQAYIGANLGVVTQLVVKAPYPGKYLQVETIDVSEGDMGGKTTFAIPVTNLGTEKLLNIKGFIDILGPTNEKIATLSTNQISLDPQKRELLKVDWEANVNPGKYLAVATVNYADKSSRIEKTFYVGTMDVEVVSVDTKNFRLGGIAKMDITIRSHWNDVIENLYADLLIKDSEWDPVAEIRTASVDLLPHSEQEINAFWDTAGLKEGKYYITLKLQFMGKTIEKQLETRLGMRSMKTTMMSATGHSIGDYGTGRNTVLSIAVIVLILINMGWFIYFKKKLKK